MFAQKTTEILRRIRRYKSIGYDVLVVNYSKDTRYGRDVIASHDVDTHAARCVEFLAEVDSEVRSGAYRVVVIDEGQFFGDLFKYVTSWSDELDIHIVVAGLDGDSDRKPFGDILKLVPYAEEVERLTAYCAFCRNGTPAVYSKFIPGKKDEQVAVGGADMYKPVCRKHYLGGGDA